MTRKNAILMLIIGLLGHSKAQNGRTNVTQVVVGTMSQISNGWNFVGSVSLVTDTGVNIIVDTPASLDNRNRDLMLQGIQNQGLTPSQINYLVTTHGHPDHFGQGQLLPNAKRLMGIWNITGTQFQSSPLTQNKDWTNISPNSEIWSTPGHTRQDISLIVRNTACCGTVAIVGDLIWNSQDILNSTISMSFAQDQTLARLSRNRVICASDWIVPGHGPMFRVTDQMKQLSVCQGRLSNSG